MMIRDRFNVNCSKPFTDDDTPIVYKVAFMLVGQKDGYLTWISESSNVTMERDAYLPSGHEDHDHNVVVVLRAEDSLGAFVDLQTVVKVMEYDCLVFVNFVHVRS